MVKSLRLDTSVDPMQLMADQVRTAPPGRPYVLTNMVASMDGAISIDGLSGALGGSEDFKVFMALRAVADVIIAGAGTVRQEQYKAPSPGPSALQLRAERGQESRPLIAVVTASGRLSPDLPLFADPTYRPLIICGSDADPDALAKLRPLADIEQLATPGVLPRDALSLLHERGHSIVLLEGGPSLNGAFIESDCIDEWNLTLSPALVGGTSGRASTGEHGVHNRFIPRHVWQGDDLLFIQWTRPDDDHNDRR